MQPTDEVENPETSIVDNSPLKRLAAGPVRQEALLYLGVVVLTMLVVKRVLGLSFATLDVPFSYVGDAVFYQAVTKGLMENGQHLWNPSLGAPGVQTLFDFPLSDGMNLLMMKLISLVVPDAVTVNNLHFLIGFPLASVTSLYVMRRFGVSRPAAFVASVAFALIPFHFMRGITHLLLSSYWPIPLATMLCLWAASDDAPFLHGRTIRWRDRRSFPALAVAVVVGCSGVYYAFFACLFLGTVAVYCWSKRRNVLFAMPALLLVGVIGGTVLLNVAPSLVYTRIKGPNPEAVVRSSVESELYAFKITQLVLPMAGHRFAWAAGVRERYNQSISGIGQGLLNENETASLGLLGTLGFFALLTWAVFRLRPSRRGPPSDVMEPLSSMNLTALLVGVFGGFGSLFSFFVSQNIRAYNRMSIYIAFFSLFALALLLDRFAFRRPWAQLPFATAAIVVALVAVAVLDQTAPTMAVNFRAQSAAYNNDASFVAKVESSIPPGAMVFQLPYAPFPESGPVGTMTDYEHLKAYLHSKTLRWSYGAYRGRETDIWQRQVSQLPTADFVAQIKDRGFKGVWVDRRGGDVKEASLQDVLGVQPLVSADGHLAFYRIP